MFNKPPATGNQSIFLNAADRFSLVLAIILTLGLTPMLYSATEHWIGEFIRNHYGREYVGDLKLVWGILCVPLIFYACRASLVTSFMAGAVYVAQRYVV